MGAVGLLVGVVVAAASVATGVAGCGHDLSGECTSLATTLSIRTGLVAGLAAMVMTLMVLGLLRMVDHDEERRAQTRASLWE